MAMELVETIEVGSGGAASIEFTSIPQTGVDLLLRLSLRSTISGVDNIKVTFNSGASTFSRIYLAVYGAVEYTNSAASQSYAFLENLLEGTDYTANTFGNTDFYISNYTSSATKSYSLEGVTENNGVTSYLVIGAGKWSGTDAITSIEITNSLAQYSTASLYIIS